MSSRQRPLILAWGLVVAALLAAVAYAFLVPEKATGPTADGSVGNSEVQISLSEIPTLTDANPPTAERPPEGDAPTEAASDVAAEHNGDAPKIAIVLSGLGLSNRDTAAAIEALPPAITLSFTPYGEDLAKWLAEARAAGHEVMIDLPMEPASFPSNDPGPKALVTSLSAVENQARLDWILGRGKDLVGAVGVMGSRFSRSRELMMPVLQTLKERGLLYLDNRATDLSVAAALAEDIGLPVAVNNRTLDESHASEVIIDARLAQIERVALTDGLAVAIAHPFPLTLERLATWSETLAARGFILVPISAAAAQTPR
ncbi:MAG TPA: divergent polysaccharide deacetylase family protein [Kiloniellaceae bacterium]|nr:divergent polysaccharide deacetylase family protein [Kiloniellaceae bacterium]